MARDGGKLRPISWKEAFSRVEDPSRRPGEGAEKPVPVRPDDRLLSRIADARANGLDRAAPEYEMYSHTAVKEANALLFGRGTFPITGSRRPISC